VGAVPTTPLTTPGLLIGTLQYMAPEQLDGVEADARTDIFAFGSIIYEVLTGKKAFDGKNQPSLAGAIMTAEPLPISRLQPSPPPLDASSALPRERSGAGRRRTIADQLRWIAEQGFSGSAHWPARRGRRAGSRSQHLASGVLPTRRRRPRINTYAARAERRVQFRVPVVGDAGYLDFA
jgi:serine/threonine protein kinase